MSIRVNNARWNQRGSKFDFLFRKETRNLYVNGIFLEKNKI